MDRFTVRPGDSVDVPVSAVLSSGNYVQVVFSGSSPSAGKAGEKVYVTDQANAPTPFIKVVSVGGTDNIRVSPPANSAQAIITWDKDFYYSLHCDYIDATGVKVSGVVAIFNVDPTPMVALA